MPGLPAIGVVYLAIKLIVKAIKLIILKMVVGPIEAVLKLLLRELMTTEADLMGPMEPLVAIELQLEGQEHSLEELVFAMLIELVVKLVTM